MKKGVAQNIIDFILDKISVSGFESLTKKEKEILDNADNPNYKAFISDLSIKSMTKEPVKHMKTVMMPKKPKAIEYDDYGIIDPTDARFDISLIPGDGGTDDIMIFVTSISNPDNDDIRGVNHPDFEDMWSNAAENVFEVNNYYTKGSSLDIIKGPSPFQNIEEAKDWCISIGMTYKPGLSCG